jgi:hypothetical protein
MTDTAISAAKFLQQLQEEALGAPLQEETPKENEEFKNAAIAIETLKEMTQEEAKENK